MILVPRAVRHADPKLHRRAGWGDGPLSGNKGYWIGMRYLPSASYTDWAAMRSALGLDAPKNFDLTNVWYPMGVSSGNGTDWSGLDAVFTEAQAWAWMRGGTDDDYTKGEGVFIPTGGPTATGNTVFRRGQWPTIWTTHLDRPVVMLHALGPPHRSTKPTPHDPYLWHELARGDRDDVWFGLGRRCAYKDSVYGRQVFPAVGARLAAAHVFVELGWEIDSAQTWSYWDAQTPASPLDNHLANSYSRDRVTTVMERLTTAFRNGYYSFDGWSTGAAQKNCPYSFGTRWRPVTPVKTGAGVKSILWNWANASVFDFIGSSAHNNTDSQNNPTLPYNATTNPNGPNNAWKSRNDGGGNLMFEGLEAYGEVCDKFNWKLMLNEYSSHYTGGYQGSDYPDLFYLSVDAFFKRYPNLAGGFCWFYGDGTMDILDNPDPGAASGPALRHALTKKHVLNLYGSR